MDGVYQTYEQSVSAQKNLEAQLKIKEDNLLNISKQELHLRGEVQEKTERIQALEKEVRESIVKIRALDESRVAQETLIKEFKEASEQKEKEISVKDQLIKELRASHDSAQREAFTGVSESK